MSESTTLMCFRVKELAGGPPVQSVIDACAVCGVAVWRALSSPPTDRVVCIACGKDEMSKNPDAELAPPTKRQWDIWKGFELWRD